MENRHNSSWILTVLLSIIMMSSCQKEYYLDDGVHDAQYDGTTMQFLASRPELFDSLTRIIKLSGLEEVINTGPVTFFAPPNASINKSVVMLNSYLYLNGQDTVLELSQIDPSVWRKYLARYIVDDTFLLKDFPQIDTMNLEVYPGQGYLSYLDEPMNIGVLYNDVTSENSAGVVQTIKYAGYRQLYLSYVYDFSDESSATQFITAPVATSDIQTHSGALHVLNFSKHSFGFDANDFVGNAYSIGVKNSNSDE